MKLNITFLILPLLFLVFGSNAGFSTGPGHIVPAESDIGTAIPMIGRLERAVELANEHFPVQSGALIPLDLWHAERDDGNLLEAGLRHPEARVVEIGQDGRYTLFGLPWRLQWPGSPSGYREAILVIRMHKTSGTWPIGFADFRHHTSLDKTRAFWDEAHRRGAGLTVPQMRQILEERP